MRIPRTDGVTLHTASQSMTTLRNFFVEQVIN